MTTAKVNYFDFTLFRIYQKSKKCFDWLPERFGLMWLADLEGTTARDLVGEGLTSKANKETKISWTSFNIIFLGFKKAEKEKKRFSMVIWNSLQKGCKFWTRTFDLRRLISQEIMSHSHFSTLGQHCKKDIQFLVFLWPRMGSLSFHEKKKCFYVRAVINFFSWTLT